MRRLMVYGVHSSASIADLPLKRNKHQERGLFKNVPKEL